ncbi:MAG: CDP-glycerol glycerophosphotransferase family protein [Acetivibrionales bacterium]
MKSLKILYKVSKRIFFAITNLLVLLVSLMIPKTNRIIVVGGWFGKRFADNSKYFFLYANENKKKLGLYKVIWITRSNKIKEELKRKGYCVYKIWSIQSIWYHLRSRIHLIDQSSSDINPFFSVRSKRINMWHGFPLKKIGTFMKDCNKNKIRKNNCILVFLDKISTRGFWSDRYILATSKFSASVLGQAFGVPSEKVIVSGYPRNYELIVNKPIKYISENEIECLNIIRSEKERSKSIIGYFPTFRDKRETLIFGIKDNNELHEVLDYFERLNIKIIGKFHFADKNDEFKGIYYHKTFVNLPSDADIYTFINEIDILITDYSSIYFDFLLWNRPIIFFPYDLEYYQNEDRGIIFDYDTITPGPKVYNVSELKALFLDGVESFTVAYHSKYQDKALQLKKKVFENITEMDIEHLIKQIKFINT